MIKVKNLSEIIIPLKKSGSAAVANNIDNFTSPVTGRIKAIFATFGVMGTDGTGAPTQDVIADIKKNGTSIFSGAGKINWAHAGQLGTANTPTQASAYGALTTNPTLVNKGDFLRLDITQILNGTAPTQPTDLTVFVVIERSRGASPVSAMLGGQVSEND
jgi:hypothetical protein